MIYKKIIVIFLLILSVFSIFSFSSVHAENINVINSNIVRMQADVDFFKRILKNNNINNMNDLKSFVGAPSIDQLQYFYIEAAGHTYYQHQYCCFYNNFNGITYR